MRLGAAARLPRIGQRGRGARHQAAQDAGQQQPAPHPGQPPRHIARQADAGDQHHHQPDVKRVERAIGAIRLIGQHGQDDGTDDAELQHRADVGGRQLAGCPFQFALEVQQRGHRDADADDQHRVAVAVGGTQQEHGDRSHGRCGAGVVRTCHGVDQMRGADDEGDGNHAGCDHHATR